MSQVNLETSATRSERQIPVASLSLAVKKVSFAATLLHLVKGMKHNGNHGMDTQWRYRVGIALIIFIGSSTSLSRAERQSDEYDFHWLDPDKKISVLQNRKFTKANRVLVSAMGGLGLSGVYVDSVNFSPRAAFYFSEAFGVEGFYGMTFNRENGAFLALQNASPNALPVVREMRSQYGGLVHWAPWYAKINVFNQVLYFDWYFSGGAGMIHSEVDRRTSSSADHDYQSQDLFGIFVGTGHQYHVTDWLIFRLDFTGSFYKANLFGTSGDLVWFSNYDFSAGLGFRL